MENEDGILYKLWLNILCGHSPQVIFRCLRDFGTAQEIYESNEKYKKVKSSMRLSQRLKARHSLDEAKELFEHCVQKDIDIITIDDEHYPKRLAEVYMPPQILYVKGALPDMNSLIGITEVGSRECTDNGRAFAGEIAFDLAKSGVIIIGGMAKGIDAAAHSGALAAGQKTIAVLAGGPDIIYPKSNTDLYYEILNRGAVISERPPGMVGRGSFYKERNRIMVGLSNGVVIIEGEQSSGTKITAGWAIDSNRDLFAVPGRPSDKNASLPNNLIKDSAKLITSFEDITEEYESVYSEELNNGINLIDEKAAEDFNRKALEFSDEDINRTHSYQSKRKSPSTSTKKKRKAVETEKVRPPKPNFDAFDDKQRKILEYLYDSNREVHIDDIANYCDIEMSELSFLIIQLEMAGAIKQSAGEYFYLT